MSSLVRKHGFSQRLRLKTPAQFKRVYNNNQWGNTRLLTFNVLYDSELPKQTSKLGITVSKKVSKLAVRRNHLKRLVREFYRHHHHQLHQANLVITVKPKANLASNKEFNDELKELWAKVMKWQRWNSHQLKGKT